MELIFIALMLLKPLMPWLARASGGGAGATRVGNGVPEWCFAFVIALGGVVLWGSWLEIRSNAPLYLIFTVGWLIAKLAIELGHTRVYTMRGVSRDNIKEPSTIERWFFQWFWEKILRQDIHTSAYSWYIMSVKGFFVALPLGPWALIHAPLWAAAYWFGFRICKTDDGTVEWMAGTATDIVLAMALVSYIAF